MSTLSSQYDLNEQTSPTAVWTDFHLNSECVLWWVKLNTYTPLDLVSGQAPSLDLVSGQAPSLDLGQAPSSSPCSVSPAADPGISSRSLRMKEDGPPPWSSPWCVEDSSRIWRSGGSGGGLPVCVSCFTSELLLVRSFISCSSSLMRPSACFSVDFSFSLTVLVEIILLLFNAADQISEDLHTVGYLSVCVCFAAVYCVVDLLNLSFSLLDHLLNFKLYLPQLGGLHFIFLL